MFASHESGWCKSGKAKMMNLQKKETNVLFPAPNDNIYCTATSLAGPWSAWADFATAGTNTFSSQTADIVSINEVVMYFLSPNHMDRAEKNRYMGDRWLSTDLAASTYIWLPLTISGTTATLVSQLIATLTNKTC